MRIGNAFDPHLVQAGFPGRRRLRHRRSCGKRSGLMPVLAHDVAQVAHALVQRAFGLRHQHGFGLADLGDPAGLLRQHVQARMLGIGARARSRTGWGQRRSCSIAGTDGHSAANAPGPACWTWRAVAVRGCGATGPGSTVSAEEPASSGAKLGDRLGEASTSRGAAGSALPALAPASEGEGFAMTGALRDAGQALHLVCAVEEAGDGVLLGLQARRRWP